MNDPDHGVVLDEVPDVVPCRACGGRAVHSPADRTVLDDVDGRGVMVDGFRCHSCRSPGWIARDLELASETVRRGPVFRPDRDARDYSGRVPAVERAAVRVRRAYDNARERVAFALERHLGSPVPRPDDRERAAP